MLNKLNKFFVIVLVSLVKFYKLTISPLLGNHCRFHPSCSVYCITALEKYGVVTGSWLTFKRLIRCNPLCKGGIDPVPDNLHAMKKGNI